MPNYTPLIQDTFTQNILAREWLKGSGATRFMYMFFGTTLGNTATEIFVDGRASNRIPIPNESSVTVVAIYSHHNVTDSEGGAKINIMSLKNIAGTVTGNSATTTVSTAAATDDASPTSDLTFTVDNT
ncbi:MAG: hypothetical protein ACRDEA_00220, partial [Microcystaceae cyanobacterium]